MEQTLEVSHNRVEGTKEDSVNLEEAVVRETKDSFF